MSLLSKEKNAEKPPPLTGGPLGLGDPDNKKLRKTERDIVIPKMLKEAATKKCSEKLETFLHCAKEAGLSVVFKCKTQNNAFNECLVHWVNNKELKDEVTEKYLENRSHYRKTGVPLEKYERKKKSSSSFC